MKIKMIINILVVVGDHYYVHVQTDSKSDDNF